MCSLRFVKPSASSSAFYSTQLLREKFQTVPFLHLEIFILSFLIFYRMQNGFIR